MEQVLHVLLLFSLCQAWWVMGVSYTPCWLVNIATPKKNIEKATENVELASCKYKLIFFWGVMNLRGWLEIMT
jgi:hypothetical protein